MEGLRAGGNEPSGSLKAIFKKIFGAKWDEVTGEWRKLHNAELHALYSSAGMIRNIISRLFAYRVLVGRSELKRPLRRPRRRWEDNIKMDLREVGHDDRDWINLAQLFENKVLRKIFGAKRDEVTGEWRKLRNSELHALYSSPDINWNIISRRLRWAGHVARISESRNAYRVLFGKPERKRLLGMPRRRWEDNTIIKMDLRVKEAGNENDSHLKQLETLLKAGYLASERNEGENAGEMSPRSSTESYLAFAQIGLSETPGKTSTSNLPRPGFEPGPHGFAPRRANRYATGMDLVQLAFSPIDFAAIYQRWGKVAQCVPFPSIIVEPLPLLASGLLIPVSVFCDHSVTTSLRVSVVESCPTANLRAKSSSTEPRSSPHLLSPTSPDRRTPPISPNDQFDSTSLALQQGPQLLTAPSPTRSSSHLASPTSPDRRTPPISSRSDHFDSSSLASEQGPHLLSPASPRRISLHLLSPTSSDRRTPPISSPNDHFDSTSLASEQGPHLLSPASPRRISLHLLSPTSSDRRTPPISSPNDYFDSTSLASEQSPHLLSPASPKRSSPHLLSPTSPDRRTPPISPNDQFDSTSLASEQGPQLLTALSPTRSSSHLASPTSSDRRTPPISSRSDHFDSSSLASEQGRHLLSPISPREASVRMCSLPCLQTEALLRSPNETITSIYSR
ncbi:hypothetical protein ANN_24813 [Periplaneta americana]|uniref:Uncharacterized protein n=1 Tax=Periplaneta americana TaxID=6978 RepID=A0ABQ8RZN0_PERAM|nr:hypothetical protein ANN_24813 [Periplaneta americana]